MSHASPEPNARRLWLALAALLFCAAAAHAAPQTFVSAEGDDSNQCGAKSPCRTFAGALAKTDVRGEVIALDSGEYGLFTVNFSVSVTAVGVYAGVTANHDTSVFVNPTAGSVVALRGLTFMGHGNSQGIIYQGPNDARAGTDSEPTAALHVEGCTFNGFRGGGINFEGNGELFVKDTTIRNTDGVGIIVASSGQQKTRATIVNSRLEKNRSGGMHIQGVGSSTLEVTVIDTVVAGKRTVEGQYAKGIIAIRARLHLRGCIVRDQEEGVHAVDSSRVTLDGSALTNNATGVLAQGGGSVRLFNTTITDNKVGIYVVESTDQYPEAGHVYTLGNNNVSFNGQDTKGNPIFIVKQF